MYNHNIVIGDNKSTVWELEDYLNFTSLCPHLADVIADRVEAFCFKMFLLIKIMKWIYAMIAVRMI